MKFGKKLQNVASASSSLCKEECWLDYKAMKKLLKSFEGDDATRDRLESRDATDEEPPPAEEDNQLARSRHLAMISKSADERRFFGALKRELAKVGVVFAELERRALTEFVGLMPLIEAARLRPHVREVLNSVFQRFVDVHGRLLLLRNFAVINYVGFTKILKKHDKVTGFVTRDRYMLRMVNDEPFSQHRSIKRALEFLEDEYLHIKRSGRLRLKADLARVVIEVRSLSESAGKPARASKIKANEANTANLRSRLLTPAKGPVGRPAAAQPKHVPGQSSKDRFLARSPGSAASLTRVLLADASIGKASANVGGVDASASQAGIERPQTPPPPLPSCTMPAQPSADAPLASKRRRVQGSSHSERAAPERLDAFPAPLPPRKRFKRATQTARPPAGHGGKEGASLPANVPKDVMRSDKPGSNPSSPGQSHESGLDFDPMASLVAAVELQHRMLDQEETDDSD